MMRREKDPARTPRTSQRPFSAARLAAGAVFGRPAAGPAERPNSAPAATAAALVAPPAQRQPKVHRIARQGAESDSALPDAGSAPHPAPPTFGSTAAAAPTQRVRRRNTRQLHGDVVVIRPPDVADEGVRPAVDAGAEERRSVALQARLRRLEAEIDVARRQAAEAIRWIHQQMDTYGITLEELGSP